MADFRTFDPCNLLAPVPAVMVSCRAPEADAKPNIVTVAWVGTVNSEPPMMSISVRGNRFSHDLIAKSGEFVVNLVDEAHCKALDFCGVRSGRDVDKWQECDLTPMPALNMDYAPAIAECPAYLACKVVQQLELGSHTMFVGKIVGVQVRDDLFAADGSLHLEKADAVQQMIEFALVNGALIAAICAAPSILGHKGLLENRRAVCFPGFEEELCGAVYCDQPVVVDLPFVTAKGAGAAMDFALELVSRLASGEMAAKLRASLQCR